MPLDFCHNSLWVEQVAASRASAGPATLYTLLLIGEVTRVPPYQIVSYTWCVVVFGFGYYFYNFNGRCGLAVRKQIRDKKL